MSNPLHIVCLDAPSPPDYGGAIDMYYKIISLAALKVNITLHYFNYNQERKTRELEPYCSKIIPYQRKTGIRGISFQKPYIVASRINKQLIDNLNSDNYPILLEGLHCTGIIPFLNQHRRIMIRVHNDEYVYYKSLAGSESNWIKKTYYITESLLLQLYQNQLPHSCTYAFISETDKLHFQTKYGITNSFFISAFLPWQKTGILDGIGSYILYHGNLSIAENEQAVIWLIKEVISKLQFPLIIAGKNASQKLLKIVDAHKNISLVNNPSEAEMHSLIQNAHIHLIPSFNQTGVKLKLLNVLFNGRFCITNKKGVEGSQLEEMVWVAETAQDYIALIKNLMQRPFKMKNIATRQKLLQVYNNEANACKLLELLYNTNII